MHQKMCLKNLRFLCRFGDSVAFDVSGQQRPIQVNDLKLNNVWKKTLAQ